MLQFMILALLMLLVFGPNFTIFVSGACFVVWAALKALSWVCRPDANRY